MVFPLSNPVDMLYGGLGEAVWRRLLQNDSLILRLCALRALAQQGEVGARGLLTGPTFRRADEGYPWIWALCQCVSPGLFRIIRLSGHPAHGPLSCVRFLLRRRQREHTWPMKRSREVCVTAMLEALHPLQTLACAVRLLEQHGERAIPALLEVLRLRPTPPPAGHGRELGRIELLDEKAECAAWALGQLGRSAVPEIVQRYRGASDRVKRHLAMTLWYLGPQASKALPCLLQDTSAQACAALLALEEGASLAMVKQGRGPLWLNEEAVCALAGIAFSDEDRDFAAAALGGFGPAAERGLPILKHLSSDPDPKVRATVARGLAWGGRSEVLPLLLSQLEDTDPEVARQAQKSVSSFYESPQMARAALFEQMLTGLPEEQQRAAMQLAGLGLPPDHEAEIEQLLRTCQEPALSHLLRALSKSGKTAAVHQEIVLRHLQDGTVLVRQAAAEAAFLLPDSQEARGIWRERLWDYDELVVVWAVKALARLGLRLPELGLGPGQLDSLPVRALARLLGEMPTILIEASDLVPLLKRRENQARQAAAMALGLLGAAQQNVIQALVARLDDPCDEVALACARALLNLGIEEYAWILLRSPYAHDQLQADTILRQRGLIPEGLLQDFIQGRLASAALEFLKSQLPAEHFLDLLDKAMPRLSLGDSESIAANLASLGAKGLDRLPEMLGHPLDRVRDVALLALKEILQAPLHLYVEWLAERGLVLPLHQLSTQARLHNIVSSFLLRAQGWTEPRLVPLLAELSRSPIDLTACRAINLLGRAYQARAEPAVCDLILAGLGHPAPSPRKEAMQVASTTLPVSSWERIQPAPFLERRVLLRAAEFARNGLDRERLGEALAWVDDLKLDKIALFVPTSCAHIQVLLSLLDDREVVSQRAMRLLWTYADPLDRATWVAVLRAAANPATAQHHAELAKRWARLVVSALAQRPDGLEWVTGLGGHAFAGLLLALRHKGPRLRQRALQVLQRWPSPPRAFRAEIEQMIREDVDPEVRVQAEEVLRMWGP